MTTSLILAFTFPFLVFYDGPADNIPANVRRIPKLGIEVPAEKREQLQTKLAQLASLLEKLDDSADQERIDRDLIEDARVFYRAASDALTFQEFFKESEIKRGLELVEQGKQRATALMNGNAPWTNDTGQVVRGFKSKIDHSVQPYGLVVPESYAKQTGKKFRLDVWLHGRGETLSEVNFLAQRQKDKGIFFQDDTIVLHPYARYSNAMKFAGEVDVLEAIDSVKKRYRIDNSRISIRGFSMGGAGCWQLAVHYPDLWFAANPGAGFSETPEFLKFFQKETLNPTWYEKKLWQWYDCNGYASNLTHLPTIAYSGENDIQKQAADVMAIAFDERGMKLNHIIGPGMGHKYHPDAIKSVAQWLDQTANNVVPIAPSADMELETFTLKYNRNHHLRIDGLKQHWTRSSLKLSEEKRVTTENVTRFAIRNPHPKTDKSAIEIIVDGQSIQCQLSSATDGWLHFHRVSEGWKFGSDDAESNQLRKVHDLQGPIDDALMDSFIFVRPTGKEWNEKAGIWSSTELDRAITQWRQHFRGQARVKNDNEITAEDITTSNLILWGDPRSNLIYGRIADQLPIAWSETEISVGDKKYDTTNHALIAIYPNPLNPNRYVVINSSFTFREFAYLNNARQVPKLPDWAIINLDTPPDSLWPGEVVDADFFDENWELK